MRIDNEDDIQLYQMLDEERTRIRRGMLLSNAILLLYSREERPEDCTLELWESMER